MSKQVFISYSSKDQNVADAVLKTLESQGISCWIASRDIPSGVDYARSILEAIAGSKVIVVLFSSHSNISAHVMREVERAIYYNTPIIPFRIENISPTQSMEYYLATVQWLDATESPIQNHFKMLCDRVRQLVTETKDPGLIGNGNKISAKSIKAFNLAYNAEQKENSNPAHAAFWLGSRYLPGFDVYELTRKQSFDNRQMVDKALFSEFEKYEQQMGFDIGFKSFFLSLVNENDPKKKHAIRQGFIHKMIDSIGANHGSQVASIWMLGILLSTLWLWIRRGEDRIANDLIETKINETFKSISRTLLSFDLPSALKDDLNEIHRNTQKSKSLKVLQDRITDWTALIEMYLLVEEYEIKLDNAEMLLEINPQLATYILQQHLKKSPDDGKALILLGKASLKIISDELSLEPLFRTDPEKNLHLSLEKTIQLQPDSEWGKRARVVLEKINKL